MAAIDCTKDVTLRNMGDIKDVKRCTLIDGSLIISPGSNYNIDIDGVETITGDIHYEKCTGLYVPNEDCQGDWEDLVVEYIKFHDLVKVGGDVHFINGSSTLKTLEFPKLRGVGGAIYPKSRSVNFASLEYVGDGVNF